MPSRHLLLCELSHHRKNWLFAGNDHFGSVAATLYSLITSAERHRIDPQRYPTSVLTRIAAIPASQLSSLLPDDWKRRDTEAASVTSPTPPSTQMPLQPAPPGTS